jgi:hypothetical protein
VKGIFKIGAPEIFVQADLKLQSFWSLPLD